MDILSLLASMAGTGANSDKYNFKQIPVDTGITPTVPPQQAPVDPDTARKEAQGIDVSARRTPPSGGDIPDIAPRSLMNGKFIDEAADAAHSSPARKGLFGVHGTLRDVLGLLGDAFLVQSGNKPLYMPHRQQEITSDAMSGFTQDPLGAIERLAYVNPAAAQKLYEDYNTNEYRLGANQARMAATSSVVQNRDAQLRGKFGMMLSGLLGSAKTPEDYANRYAVAQKRAAALGYDLSEDFGISDTYDPATISGLRDSGMTGNQAESNDIRRESIQASNQRAAAHEAGLDRRYQPRPQPNPTVASLAAPILQKVRDGEPLSSQEEEFLNRTGFNKDRGQKKQSALAQILGGATPGNPSKPSSGRFQPGQIVTKNGKQYKVGPDGKGYPIN